MIINGTISQVSPPDYTDRRYGNQYQNIAIDTPSGPITGRIGCKKPYTTQDIGGQGQWDCEQASNAQGTYNKLKKHFDQPYQAQQAPSRQPQQPNGGNNNDMVRIRSMAAAYAKDLVVAGQLTLSDLYDEALSLTAFIVTGKIPTKLPDNKGGSEWDKAEESAGGDTYEGRL